MVVQDFVVVDWCASSSSTNLNYQFYLWENSRALAIEDDFSGDRVQGVQQE